MSKKATTYSLTAIISIAVGIGAMYFLKPVLMDSMGLFEKKEEVTNVIAELKKNIEQESLKTEMEKQEITPESESQEIQAQEAESITAQESVVAPEPIKEPVQIVEEPVVELPTPVLITSRVSVVQDENETFTITGLVAKDVGIDMEFVLSDEENHRYASSSGQFTGVSGNAKGTYVATVKDLNTGKISVARAIKGFIVQKPVSRMSVAEVEAMFNTGNADEFKKKSDHFVDKVAFRCNKPEVTTISSVFTQVSMEDLKVSVSDLEYDFLGRIKSLTITLN